MAQDFKRRFIVSAIITIPVLVLSPLIQEFLGYSLLIPGSEYILWVLSTAIFFYGGKPFFNGFFSETRTRKPGMMTLVTLATGTAYVYSSAVVFGFPGKFFFWELVTLIDVMLLGHWLEMKSVLGATGALEKLAQLLPNTAHMVMPNMVHDVALTAIKKGDTVLVKPGEKIPTDGIVINGSSFVNEAFLTGESVPVKKSVGGSVVAGSINGDGALYIKVNATGEDSYLSRVINLVKEAQEAKSKTQMLADRAAMYLTGIGVSVSVITLVVWLALQQDLAFAVERMVTVMVITCPHALGLAIPLVGSMSTSLAASNALLIRNKTAFENSRKITIVVFDKTGTLTEGKFSVNSVKPLDKKYTVKKILSLAASLEKQSEHPIANAILERAKNSKAKLSPAAGFQNMKGQGVSGKIGKDKVLVVGKNYLGSQKIIVPEVQEKAATLVYVLVNEKPVGVLTLSDKIRPEARDAVRQLKSAGIKTMMITGDNEKIAKKVANELKLDGYFAQVLPHEKQEKIKELQANGEFVAMAGDGVNDAPALAQADVGIAIGSGTDIAAETADIILVDDNPKGVYSTVRFGRATYGKMVQNLLWATGYNVVAIPLAAGVLFQQGILLSPALGAAFMSLSTVIVALNARLLKFK